MAFITAAGERAFRTAIEEIEKVSATEVVIAVRPRLSRWLVPNIAVGGVAMFGVLAYWHRATTGVDGRSGEHALSQYRG